MKDISFLQLQKVADRVTESGALQKNRYLSLRQMGVSPKAVTGIHKLAQFVTKLLMTTQGSDQFDPNYGSGLLFMLKDAKTLHELNAIRGDIASHVLDLRRQIIMSQSGISLPADERLRDLQLVAAVFDEGDLKYSIELRLVSEAGEDRQLRLSDLVV